MAVIHWAITNMNGEMVGQHCQIKASSNIDRFNNFVPPAGYMKVLLSHADYEKLTFSFNRERKIYERRVDPRESKAVEVYEERKAINEAKAKPNKYRERFNKKGNLVKEFYDKDGNLDRTEIVDKNSNPVIPQQ